MKIPVIFKGKSFHSQFLSEWNGCNCFLAAKVAHENISVPKRTNCIFKNSS